MAFSPSDGRETEGIHTAAMLSDYIVPNPYKLRLNKVVPAAIALIQVKSVFFFFPRKPLITEVPIPSRIFAPDLRKTLENALKPNYHQSPNHPLFLSCLACVSLPATLIDTSKY